MREGVLRMFNLGWGTYGRMVAGWFGFAHKFGRMWIW